uniref:RNA-directed DNA polymerase n=1 Tax=Strongyloides venezuelensis TaxID=75913 RepID=A0A0K0FSN2_STRVS
MIGLGNIFLNPRYKKSGFYDFFTPYLESKNEIYYQIVCRVFLYGTISIVTCILNVMAVLSLKKQNKAVRLYFSHSFTFGTVRNHLTLQLSIIMVVTRAGPPTMQRDEQITDNHVQPTSADDMQRIVRLLTEQKETMSTLITSISNIESRLQQVEIIQNQIPGYPTSQEGGRTLNDPAAEDYQNGKNKNKKNNRRTIKSPKINQENDDNDGNYHNISQLSSQIEALSINSSTGIKRPPNISLEKFNGKISFQIWLKKFMAYCKINSIDSDMKHEVLLLMLEDEPASDANRIELYDFHTLSSFLYNKYKGQYSIASAFHELEIITSRPVRKPEELDATCKKISDIIEILEESKPTDYILQRKIEALSKVLPLELRSKILLTASIFPSFDVAISSTKRAWALDYRADIERNKGNTLSKNKKKKKYCSNCNTNTHNTDMCRLKDKNKHRKEKINKVDDEESSMNSSSSSSSSEDEESVYKISESIEKNLESARNSPGIFQRIMEIIFSPLKDNMLIYQDDLLIISDGNETLHKELLYQFFSIARQHGLKINFNKSKFFKKIVSFLGWDISPTGVTPSLKSVESIMKLKLPVDKKQLYQRLQKFSYHRLAIKDYAKLSSKLYEMTSGRNCKIKLTGENLKNYLSIVETLYKQPLLYHANPSKPYILTCDASATAIGATLSQLDDSQIERPISFFSCKLPHVKKPRSATYNELYAIKRALQFNKYLLTGAHIQIRSDHRPLEKLVQNTQEKRFYDLVECINSYNCSIEYIEGVKNSSADYLSRLPHSDVSSESDVEREEVNILLRKKTKKNYNEVQVMRNIFQPTSKHTLKDENKINDDKITSSLMNGISLKKRGPVRPRKIKVKDNAKQTINNALRDNEDIKTPKIGIEHLFLSNKDYSSLINGIVHVQVPSKEGGNDLLPIIPCDPDTCQLVFNICHSQSGHFGLNKSLEFLKTYGYLKKSRKIFEQFYKKCITCAEVNSPLQKHCEMKTIQYSRPFENLAVDICGSIQPTSQRGNKFIIIFIDSMTRFTMAYPIKKYDYEHIIECLQDLVFTHGAPVSIRCDNAPNFKSHSWKDALDVVNINLQHSTEYHSRGNSLAERALRNLQDGLKKLFKEDVLNWDKCVKPLCYFYNINICKSTNTSPYFLHYLRQPYTYLNKLLQTDVKYKVDINRPLSEIVQYAKKAYETANAIIQKSSEARKALVNPKYILEQSHYKEGDKVYAKLPDFSRGKKLAKKWKGPYTIIKMEDAVAFITLDSSPKKKIRKLHIDKLKKFFSNKEE